MTSMRLKIREEPPNKKIKLFYVLVGLALAFFLIAFIISLTGADPLFAFQELLTSPFRNIHNITEILMTATPLLLISMGLIPVYKMNFWNIGGEGQFYAGALLCTATVLALKGIEIPSGFLIILLLVIGFLGGALWILLAVLLKVKFQINEIIVTLLQNFIMIYIVSYLLYGPWMDPLTGMPQTELFPLSARIPKLIEGTRLHMGLFLALFSVPLIHMILNRSVLGYQIKAIGGSLKAASFGGIKISRTLLLAAIMCGGLAGLAGVGEVTGVFYRLRGDISPEYGYTAILIALLGKKRPGLVALVAVLFSALIVGGFEMQTATGIPSAISFVAQAIIFFSIIGSEYLSLYKIKLRGR